MFWFKHTTNQELYTMKIISKDIVYEKLIDKYR